MAKTIQTRKELSLIKDGWGYRILLDGEFVRRVWADSDKTATALFLEYAEKEGF